MNEMLISKQPLIYKQEIQNNVRKELIGFKRVGAATRRDTVLSTGAKKRLYNGKGMLGA
jgi:hypothetical protein